ncbi:MAG: NADH-quinone oxidoreductase subunit NuoG, partial [Parachlamydia sp.]|nr:NADH-quinone oxidoreductase subunit NuoG [Parachlamydia sp.]
MANEATTMIRLTIDGKEVTVPKGTTVYTAAQKLGIEIPIFCYQDRMPPFGACRMCLVEVEKMPKLQTSCTLEATEGMVVKTQSQIAVEGREGILEFLLINHPLDCPICDRGGECPLQDQTIKFGPGKSRFYEEKRHFSKRKSLGPVLMLDRERCIACARCTRFGEIVAGDHALEFIDRGYKTEVGTPDGGPAESKFIGNTIMICPVGALTSDVYRFRARPWDNDSANSTCTLCPVGCSMILDSRDGEIVRTRSLENREVNDIWLCDKGWFGYEFTSHPDRLQTPLMRRNGSLQPASWEEALTVIAVKIKEASPDRKLAGFGGNPLTVEENYLFQKLMREGAGVNHVDHRIGMPIIGLEEEGLAPGMEMTIGECEELSFAILFGIDLTEEFPIIWLRLKQAINRGAKVIFLGNYAPEIARHLTNTVLHAPGQELKILQEHLPHVEELAKSGKGAIFVGRQYLHSPQRLAILSELHKMRKANLKLNILEGRGNSMGARFAGMRPDLGPLEKPLSQPGYDANQVLDQAA